ncbi:phage holin family protein [Luteolibacter sp. AS25]|uniref:phage holin family protein n=1 Tax=Luteolibacter sp. AS25 TaxID=3135776 RepID=UPI00398B1A15
MSEEPNIPEIASQAEAEIREDNRKGPPSNWKEALSVLAATRSSIMKVEGKQVATDLGKKIALAVVALLGLLFSWILLMFGLVGVLSDLTPMNWWQAAFSVGGLHILIAILLLLIAKSIGSEPFPITRKEFEKDREWLNQLKQQSKSQS